jgi:glycosyltransferase involved in cell wall biosynthesis
MPSPLNIAYLLEDTDLSGGVRVQLAQADALIARGHQVTMFTKGMPLRWRRSRAEWRHVDDFSGIDASPFDFVIGGFWVTVEPAYRLAGDRALHLCQGYEGNFTAYQEIRHQIDATYRLPIPKLVVSRSLIPVCQAFGHEVTYIGQIVDDAFYRDGDPIEHEPLRVLLAGASEIDFKGIDLGYGAAAHARSYGGKFDLLRVSPWAPGHDEPVQELVAEFHVALSSEQMVRLVHSCDIFLGPSRSDEGFGLPAAEAMAAGLPAVLTRIPSFLAFAESQDFALFADEGDAAGLGDQLFELLQDEELRRTLRQRGRQVAEQFRAQNTAERLERYLLERRARMGSTARISHPTR